MRENLLLAVFAIIEFITILVLSEKIAAQDFEERPAPYQEFTNLTKKEIEELDQLVYWASAEMTYGIEVQMGIIQTVFNRCQSKEFPNTIHDVIYQIGSNVVDRFYSKPLLIEDAETINGAIENVVNGEMIIPEDYYYFSQNRKETNIESNLWIGEWELDEKNNIYKPKRNTGLYFDKAKANRTGKKKE